MSDFDALRAQTLELFPPLLDVAVCRGADRTRDRLVAARAQLEVATLTLVVCGEFKRGKSSLLNALLEEQPPLFPVDTVLATSLVTRVSWGPAEEIVVELRDGDGKTVEQRPITRAQIPEYATETGNPDNAKGAALLTVRTPNPRLQSGLVLVDTPGVGGTYTEHSAVTTAFLPNADALLFVCSFDHKMGISELRFLRSAIEAADATGDADALVVAINKADLLGTEQRKAHLTGELAKLTELTGRTADQLNVVPISSRMKLDFLHDADPDDLADSNFEPFERVLWAATTRRRARLILATALADLDRTVHALLAPLESERAALEARTKQRLDALAAESDNRRRQLSTLTAQQAAWSRQLREAIGKGVLKSALKKIDAVWFTFETEYLEDPAYLDTPDELVARLAADAAAVAAAVGDAAQRQAATVLREFSREHGLDLSTPEVAALPAPSVPPLEVRGQLRGADRTGRGLERLTSGSIASGVAGGIGGTGAGFIGGVIGTLIAPGVGTYLGAQLGAMAGSVVGGIFGAVQGYRKAVKKQEHADRAARRNSLLIELRPLRTAQTDEITAGVEQVLRVLGDAVVAELESRIAQQRESVADSATRIAATREEAQAEAKQRAAALDGEFAPLRSARARIADLARRTDALGSATAPSEPAARTAARPVARQDDDFADE